ncbi:MAG TPA: RagB/SusD family nutrient uptake outer membrane protein, partial [Fodinibius sp.]|nr:RagB/SusD family nutrient uptake outer membrane protein [Fodinibius sp.]
MKKPIYICSLLVLMMLGSCKDFLDREPSDSYGNSTLWTSASDVEAALNSIYNGWRDGMSIIYFDAASDNAYNQFPWEGYTALGNMQLLTPTNTGAGKWGFSTIQRANWFLENVNKAAMDTTLKLRMIGEARFLRAYEYFLRGQLYGDFPLVTKTISPTEANQVMRTPKDSVMNFVVNELGEIAPDLPLSYSGDNKGRITKGAALALKARVELFRGNYLEAAKDAKSVMDLGVYELFPDYGELFRIQNEHNSSVILNYEYEPTNQAFAGIQRFPSSSYGGWASIVPLQSLVEAYEMESGKAINASNSGYDPAHPYKNRDPRLEATIVYPGKKYSGKYYDPISSGSSDYYAGNNNSKSGYLVKKFAPKLDDFNSDISNTGLNIIVLRYAEVLLTYAEAKIELNEIDQSVYEAINKVRDRAGMPPLDQSKYSGQQEMREAVRHERRVELAMEGLRWFDIQRWEIGDTVMNGQTYGARLGTVDSETGKVTWSDERIEVENRVFDPSKNYLWPVPQSERDIND